MYNIIVLIILIILIGYLFGSIPIGYLYCKAHGVNIFTSGSGNPGSTNVGRVLGKKHGRIVFALDIIKTLLGIFIAHLLMILIDKLWGAPYFKNIITNPHITFIAGLGTIIGHNFPFATKFKGGKGITCTVAVIAYFNVIFAVVLFLIHKIIGKLTGYVSLASIITLVIMFLSSLIMSIFNVYPFNFEFSGYVLPTIFLMMLLGIIRHKDNILRLEHGTENKV